MNAVSAIAIFVGAGLGALLRWGLGHGLNAMFPALPPGTLAANVLGALLMGAMLGVFAQYETLTPVVRLALTTGFLGGLTTFSTFSAESALLLARGDYRWACLHTFAHVGLCLLATLGGLSLTRWLYTLKGGGA